MPYSKQKEPEEYKKRSYNWKTAIGLQAVAVFAIKYLRTLGFIITNEPFESDSWYFRNALVRANYQNLKEGVHKTRDYLERFFENALLGGGNKLRNRELLVGWGECRL